MIKCDSQRFIFCVDVSCLNYQESREYEGRLSYTDQSLLIRYCFVLLFYEH